MNREFLIHIIETAMSNRKRWTKYNRFVSLNTLQWISQLFLISNSFALDPSLDVKSLYLIVYVRWTFNCECLTECFLQCEQQTKNETENSKNHFHSNYYFWKDGCNHILKLIEFSVTLSFLNTKNMKPSINAFQF